MFRHLSIVAIAVLFGSQLVLAQVTTGTISGTVQDASGAAIPGTEIAIRNLDTGAARTITSDPDGRYAATDLPVGNYEIQAQHAGFQTEVRSGITLTVGRQATVNLGLKVGQISEKVTVTGEAPLVETTNANISYLVDEKKIADLPLNGRNFLSLLFLGAGAVETAGEQGVMRQGAGNAISLMGARPTSNNFMIDGTSNTDTALGTPAVILSVDAMEEFKEQTKTYSAEYGFSANQINLVSKSGTNQFHGTFFYFGRDESLDAKNYFDSPTSKKPTLDQKQFGGTISGPIIKDKTFLLFNYEGARINRGSSAFFIVPTPDQLAGRFSTTIIDPLTGQPLPSWR